MRLEYIKLELTLRSTYFTGTSVVLLVLDSNIVKLIKDTVELNVN